MSTMLLASQHDADFDAEEAPASRHLSARLPQISASDTPAETIVPGAGYKGSSNRTAMLLIAALHVVAIALFVKYDVLDVRHKAPAPIMIELQPLAEAPPPQPQQRAQDTPKVETPIVSPPPIVQTPVAAPPIAAVPVAPPVVPAAPVVAPAPPAPVIAAPIVPPDGMAANLGNPAPRYPIESRRAHEEGTVRLRVTISSEGMVEDISVFKTSGYDRLDKAALETVRKWRFRAGTQAGKPVEAVGYLSIPFVLSH